MMRAIVTDDHQGEGVFPVFTSGLAVEGTNPCGEYKGWLVCSIDGIQTYIPDRYIRCGKLIKDYNPTELIVSKGDTIEVLKIVYEWLYARNKDGACGWLPASNVVSVGE